MYPPGGYYKRHIDAVEGIDPQGSGRRCVSFICYLRLGLGLVFGLGLGLRSGLGLGSGLDLGFGLGFGLGLGLAAPTAADAELIRCLEELLHLLGPRALL